MREVNDCVHLPLHWRVLEEVLYAQSNNALEGGAGLAVLHAEGVGVVVLCDVFGCIVHGVSDAKRAATARSAEARDWVIQPVEGAGPELDLLILMDTEGPVDRQIVIKVGSGAHIGEVLTALRPNG